MTPYDALIFDLDGTLWDTCDAVAVAWNDVLARHRIAFRAIVADDVRRVTGRPHAECVRSVFRDLPEAQIELLIDETMREDNLAIERLGGVLYPGVEAGLRQLARHYPLFIVSNCQAGYIEVFQRGSGLGSLFTDTECWGNTGKTKGENAAQVIARNGLYAPLFVGDTEGDRDAARACGVPFAHVTYGFGHCGGADLVVGSFAELVARVLPPELDGPVGLPRKE